MIDAEAKDREDGIVELSDDELDRVSGGALRVADAEESVEIRANKATPMLMFKCASGKHI